MIVLDLFSEARYRTTPTIDARRRPRYKSVGRRRSLAWEACPFAAPCDLLALVAGIVVEFSSAEKVGGRLLFRSYSGKKLIGIKKTLLDKTAEFPSHILSIPPYVPGKPLPKSQEEFGISDAIRWLPENRWTVPWR
jgi:hypothetical protein